MSDNPFKAPEDASSASQIDQPLGVKEAYNVVSDTVTGVNVRWSDNKFQAIFVFVSTLVFAVVGMILALLIPKWGLPWFGGLLVGGFAGLVIGFFASGIVLMIYRASNHLKGKHD